MIRSMTGFGRANEKIEGFDVTFEIKSVNHRYFEFYSRLPRNYSFLEEKIKSLVKEQVSRGKIECQVQIDTGEREKTQVKLNGALVDGYLRALDSLEKLYGVENDVRASDMIGLNDFFTLEKEKDDEAEVEQAVISVAQKALENFLLMRHHEGEKLKKDILSRVKQIKFNLGFIEKKSPETLKQYEAKLLSKIQELLEDAEIDRQRLLTETAIFADKIAVAEETVRLHSHLTQLEELLASGGVVGRKMDFLLQELNREVNTIGSKAQDLEIAKLVVDMKADIEKIREQVQNIE
ncbi:MAG: YicC family protein [Clostridiales bacterium]|nr:YicC family protein [Clostridiales bacterium]